MKRQILFLIVLTIILLSCAAPKTTNADTAVSEIKALACNKADQAGTCFTKLPQLGIITPEECCEQMGKCCGGEQE